MYRVAEQLPESEKFGLASQVRRAAVSLTNNIAEGHGRYHFPDQIKFMLHSRGSLEEMLDDLKVCEDERYLAIPEIDRLKTEGWRVHKVINGYIRFLRSRTVDKSPRVQESPDNELSGDEFGDLIRFNPSSL